MMAKTINISTSNAAHQNKAYKYLSLGGNNTVLLINSQEFNFILSFTFVSVFAARVGLVSNMAASTKS